MLVKFGAKTMCAMYNEKTKRSTTRLITFTSFVLKQFRFQFRFQPASCRCHDNDRWNVSQYRRTQTRTHTHLKSCRCHRLVSRCPKSRLCPIWAEKQHTWSRLKKTNPNSLFEQATARVVIFLLNKIFNGRHAVQV